MMTAFYDPSIHPSIHPHLCICLCICVSIFAIQTKDAQGNNKYESQGSDTFRVHAFLPQVDPSALRCATLSCP